MANKLATKQIQVANQYGFTVGSKVILSSQIEYAKAGVVYVVEEINGSGMYLRSNGGATSVNLIVARCNGQINSISVL